MLPTQLIPDEKEGKVLRVRMIQKENVKFFDPAYLFDEGSTINWVPCGRKLTCSFPGIKFFYGPDTYYGEEVHLSSFSCFLSSLPFKGSSVTCAILKTPSLLQGQVIPTLTMMQLGASVCVTYSMAGQMTCIKAWKQIQVRQRYITQQLYCRIDLL